MTDQPQSPYDPYAREPFPGRPEPRDPDTQVWQGPTHQDHAHGATPPPSAAWSSADTAHLPLQAPLPPEQPARHGQHGQHSGAAQYGQHGQTPPHGQTAPHGQHGRAARYGQHGQAAPPVPPAAPYTSYTSYDPDTTHVRARPGHAEPPARPHSPAPAPAPATDTAPGAGQHAAPLTPAQRARAAGESPIIAPGLQPALLTAALAALIALAAPLHQAVLAVPVVLLQAVTAAGWFRLNGMWPARQGIALAFAGGLTADIALLATGPGDAATVGIGTLGVWFPLVLILQLRNRGSSDERLYALTAGLASSALAIVAAGHLAAAAHSVTAVVAGAVAVAAATVVRALPLPAAVSYAAALAAAVAAGLGAGLFADAGGPGALLGAVAGVCALVGLRVASYDYPSRFVHMTAGVALPLAVAAPAVYVLSRAIG